MKETQIWPPILTILLPPLNYNLRWLKMVLCIAINNRSYLDHAVIFGKLYIVVEKFSKMSHVKIQSFSLLIEKLFLGDFVRENSKFSEIWILCFDFWRFGVKIKTFQ